MFREGKGMAHKKKFLIVLAKIFFLNLKFRGNSTQKDEIFGTQPNLRINTQKNYTIVIFAIKIRILSKKKISKQ